MKSRVFPLCLLVLTGLSMALPILGQSPVSVAPQELYRFRISNTDLGYSLSALYAQSLQDGLIYDGVVGSIYRPPTGYTPDPASGLVPLYRWTVVENGWRVYTYHSIYYAAHPSNYTYNGILGYVFPPATAQSAARGLLSQWYSQSYGVFNGRGAPGYLGFEYPPHSSFVYQGSIAAMGLAVSGTRPDFCTDPATSIYCVDPFITNLNVTFYPPPPAPTCNPNQRQSCLDNGGTWNASTCTCRAQQCPWNMNCQ